MSGTVLRSDSLPSWFGPMTDERKQEMFAKASQKPPRYLFRAWRGVDPKGYNFESSALIVPKAFHGPIPSTRHEPNWDKAPETFEQLSDIAAEHLLEDHARQNDIKRGTVFSSRTASFSSLRLYQHHPKYHPHISVIDTSKLPATNRVISLDSRIKSILGDTCFPDEYLVYGPITPMHDVSLANGEHFRLFDHIPIPDETLKTDESLLVKAPNDRQFEAAVTRALRFSALFKEEYQFVVAVSFLGAVCLCSSPEEYQITARKVSGDLRTRWKASPKLLQIDFMNEDSNTWDEVPEDAKRTSTLYGYLQRYYEDRGI